MAGFYVVATALIMILTAAVIIIAFELLSVLSIVFSAISLSKSKRYIALGGRYSFKTVKGFHIAALVLFIFGCVSVFVFATELIFSLISLANVFAYKDIGSVISEAVPLILGAGKNAAVVILGVNSFRRYSGAKKLRDRLSVNVPVNGGGYFYGRKSCPKCGYENSAGYNYCTMCGEKLDKSHVTDITIKY